MLQDCTGPIQANPGGQLKLWPHASRLAGCLAKDSFLLLQRLKLSLGPGDIQRSRGACRAPRHQRRIGGGRISGIRIGMLWARMCASAQSRTVPKCRSSAFRFPHAIRPPRADGRFGPFATHRAACSEFRRTWRLEGQHGSPGDRRTWLQPTSCFEESESGIPWAAARPCAVAIPPQLATAYGRQTIGKVRAVGPGFAMRPGLVAEEWLLHCLLKSHCCSTLKKLARAAGMCGVRSGVGRGRPGVDPRAVPSRSGGDPRSTWG